MHCMSELLTIMQAMVRDTYQLALHSALLGLIVPASILPLLNSSPRLNSTASLAVLISISLECYHSIPFLHLCKCGHDDSEVWSGLKDQSL